MKDSPVRVPILPKGITRKKVGNYYYIYYTEGRKYNPETRLSQPNYVCIGKEHPDNRDFMIPNDNFYRFFRRESALERKVLKCEQEVETCLAKLDKVSALVQQSVGHLQEELQSLQALRAMCEKEQMKDLSPTLVEPSPSGEDVPAPEEEKVPPPKGREGKRRSRKAKTPPAPEEPAAQADQPVSSRKRSSRQKEEKPPQAAPETAAGSADSEGPASEAKGSPKPRKKSSRRNGKKPSPELPEAEAGSGMPAESLTPVAGEELQVTG